MGNELYPFKSLFPQIWQKWKSSQSKITAHQISKMFRKKSLVEFILNKAREKKWKSSSEFKPISPFLSKVPFCPYPSGDVYKESQEEALRKNDLQLKILQNPYKHIMCISR